MEISSYDMFHERSYSVRDDRMLKRFAFEVKTGMASSTAPLPTLPGGALLHQDSRGPEAMEEITAAPTFSFFSWDIGNQAFLIGNFLDGA
jgi:hypothetical protein